MSLDQVARDYIADEYEREGLCEAAQFMRDGKADAKFNLELRAIKAAILGEQERCARKAELHIRDCGDGDDTPLHEANFTCKRIAAVIRHTPSEEKL